MEEVNRQQNDVEAEKINVTQQESGVKGGSVAAYAPGYAAVAEEAGPLGWVSWPGIWAGLVTALSLGLWLAVIGYALFPPNVIGRPGGPAMVTGPDTGFYIWSGIGYLVALFIGGYIASRFGRVRGMFSALGNGVFLWGLTFSLLLLLMMLGTANLGIFRGPAMTATGPIAAGRAIAQSVSAAWWFALFQFLALLAAIGGAYLGLRPEDRRGETQ